MTTVADIELAWLAGLLDGEGAFYIGKSQRKDRTHCIYHPDIRVEMVDEPTVRKVSELLTRLEVHHTFKSLPMRNPKHRPRHIVWLGRLSAVQRLSQLLLPFLVTKKNQAELLIKFCVRREVANVDRYKGGKRFLAVTYGPEDVALYEEGRRLNKRGLDV